ncbi:PIN domain-containing protein [Anabaena azotica]|uniref:hypothetical protein n=1 Tax=Anabaena azotica TaxID=197653 RepID=UPI001F551B4E|nr:hypothetical protein [Anabaena azotica]
MATTRNRRLLLTPAEALERMRTYLAACHVVDITRLITLEAIRGVEIHNFQFWDAQIWATASSGATGLKCCIRWGKIERRCTQMHADEQDDRLLANAQN